MKVPFTNNSNQVACIGVTMLMPNETRMVEASDIPEALREPESPNSGDELEKEPGKGGDDNAALLAILDGTVPEVESALEQGDYTADDLAALQDAEVAAGNRKGVLDAIELAVLALDDDEDEDNAALLIILNGTVDEVAAALDRGDYTADDLATLQSAEQAGQNRTGVLTAITAAISALAPV